MGFPILDILNIGTKIIDRVIPDPAQKAAAQLELMKLQQTGELEQMHADSAAMHDQAEIDKIEASSPSLFKSGWRPAVGWVCVLGLAYGLLGQPLLAWISTIRKWPVPPTLDMGTLVTLLFAMLGIGVMRTTEKLQGAS